MQEMDVISLMHFLPGIWSFWVNCSWCLRSACLGMSVQHPESFGCGLLHETFWAAMGHVVNNSSILVKAKEVGVGELGEKKPWECFARERQRINFSSWMRVVFFLQMLLIYRVGFFLHEFLISTSRP